MKSHKNSLIFLWIIVVYLLINSTIAFSMGNQDANLTFKDLNKDSVLVIIYGGFLFNLTTDINQSTSMQKSLENILKTKLESLGLKVSTRLSKFNFNNYPNIYVSLQFLPLESGNAVIGYAYDISLALRQRVKLERNPKLNDQAITWIRTKVKYSNKNEIWPSIIDDLKNEIQAFTIEYYKAN